MTHTKIQQKSNDSLHLLRFGRLKTDLTVVLQGPGGCPGGSWEGPGRVLGGTWSQEALLEAPEVPKWPPGDSKINEKSIRLAHLQL